MTFEEIRAKYQSGEWSGGACRAALSEHGLLQHRMEFFEVVEMDDPSVVHELVRTHAPIHSFTCPACGGHHFGRDTAKNAQGVVDALSTVRCHDQFGIGCQWRGEWR